LKDEVLKIMPVQKQTRAGQRTRFKVSVFTYKINDARYKSQAQWEYAVLWT